MVSFITHAFIHATWPHLLVNMFVLYMFGRNVEVLTTEWESRLELQPV
jgi:membrane associated rhomboid family serine protease